MSSRRLFLSAHWVALGIAFLAAIVLSASGCTLNRAGEQEVALAWERHQTTMPNRAGAYAAIPATQPTTDSSGTVPGQPATNLESVDTLREYIILALENNPEILKAGEAARAKAARIPQVTALPDPMLTTRTLPEPVRTAEGDNYFTLGISQRLPLPEKLDRAGKIALQETRGAIAEWEKVRLRVIADVKRAYFQVYVIDRTVEITRENQQLLDGLIDVARGQVAAGKRQQEDVLRAQVEYSSLEARIIELKQSRVSATAMLNMLLNRHPSTPVPSPHTFSIRQLDANLGELLAKAAEVNPELARLRHQIDRDKEAVALARLAYWPDLNLGFEWMSMQPRDAFVPPINPATGKRPKVSQMSEEGTDNWGIMIGINVPIWFEKIEAGIREAKRTLAASNHAYASAKNMVQFRVADALTNVQAQRELAELFDGSIIPQAQQAYQVSRTGYSAGRSDFQYVIDNWQKWLMFTIQYHRAIGALERSVADLEAAIGLSLSELESSSKTEE